MIDVQSAVLESDETKSLEHLNQVSMLLCVNLRFGNDVQPINYAHLGNVITEAVDMIYDSSMVCTWALCTFVYVSMVIYM